MQSIKNQSARILLPALLVLASSLSVGLLLNLIKASGGYEIVLSELNKNSKAQEILGSSISAGWYVSGQMRDGGETPLGFGLIHFPVYGSRSSATVYAEVLKENHQWRLLYLALKEKEKPLVKLIEDPLSTYFWQPKLQ